MELEKKYYYSDEATGACAQGFAEIDGESYYFNDSCEMVKGWITIDKNRYHFADDGKMTKGWYKNRLRVLFQGRRLGRQGFTKIKDKYYYFDKKISCSPAGMTLAATLIISAEAALWLTAGRILTKILTILTNDPCGGNRLDEYGSVH